MIKCGIIGCGVIAPTHIEGYQKLPDVSVTHLCDLVAAKADALAEKYHVPHRSTDYHELLADPEVDLVSICTDHGSHRQIFLDALAAGKHVVCEKSPGRVLDDLAAMTAAADAHPGLVAAGIFQHRHEPVNRTLREWVAAGKFGTLLTVNLSFNCLRDNSYYLKDAWRGTIEFEGGGVLINQAIHYIDQLRFLFGGVRRLVALTANKTHQGVIEVEDTAAFLLEFDSGVFGTVSATNSAATDWQNLLTVSGTKLFLEFSEEHPRRIDSHDAALAAALREALEKSAEKASASLGKSYYGGGHTAQLADIVAAIREKRAPEVTIREAADSAAVVMAVYESAKTGNWIDVRKF